ncbi:MAG: type II toxin-antitoxin system VapC family toxin [Desulfobacterales bacterium]|nr:type II toxin-antitoxin system VapC family toxin [Desulfobacterales bacterium]
MIALDTNALVRLLIEDNEAQAKAVQQAVLTMENEGRQVVVLPEVLMETVWVLESVYQCTRKEIASFLENLLSVSTFRLVDALIIRQAVAQYKKRGDFADMVIVGQAKRQQARHLLSFDKKLQKLFPGYVVEKIEQENPLSAP